MTCYWLSRHFRNPDDYKLAYLLDSFRWPETAPRTDTPLDFAALLHRHF